jgi:hypothetical protein
MDFIEKLKTRISFNKNSEEKTMDKGKIINAVCVKCKVMKDQLMVKHEIPTSRGIKYMWKGVCDKCGTKMSKFTSKDG